MVPSADHPAPLSVTRAFVVQFRADAAVEQGLLAGRVGAWLNKFAALAHQGAYFFCSTPILTEAVKVD
jgi:hypothetical protein